MDLISKEAIKKYISAPCIYVEGRRIFYEEDLELMDSAFEGKTNGEVIISLYPDLKYTIQNGRVVTTIGVASSFDLDWWNSQYQKKENETWQKQ